MRRRLFFLVALAGIATNAVAAPAPSWTVDKAVSAIRFSSSLNGQGFAGAFRRWDAVIRFDPTNLAGSSVTASIDATSAATGDADRDLLQRGEVSARGVQRQCVPEPWGQPLPGNRPAFAARGFQAFDSAVHSRHHRTKGDDDGEPCPQPPGVRRRTGRVAENRRASGERDGVDRLGGDPRQIALAAEALRAGGLVILPTETVYGLAADAGNATAVAALYAAKGRPSFNPLIAHVLDAAAAAAIADLDDRARRLIEAFWPGPLTIVAPIRERGAVCDLARAGLDSVAVRAPAHPVARRVLAAFGGPVVAPSANRSGRPSPTTFIDAVAETGPEAAVTLDGGPCAVGLESTVVSLLDRVPRLLRPGAVTRVQIEALIGPLVDAGVDAGRSPGRLARHYAPNSPVRLNATSPLSGEAWLAFGEAPEDPATFNLSPSRDLNEAAANLFTFLRAADRLSPRAIAVAPIPHTGLGEAINDRLERAAGRIG